MAAQNLLQSDQPAQAVLSVEPDLQQVETTGGINPAADEPSAHVAADTAEQTLTSTASDSPAASSPSVAASTDSNSPEAAAAEPVIQAPLADVDLAVTKDDGGVLAMPGGVISYSISYSNSGPDDASGTALTEIVPDNTTFDPVASDPGWACLPDSNAGSLCVLNVGVLAATDSGTADFVVIVDDPVPGGVMNIVNTVAIASGDIDNNPLNDSDTVTTPLNWPPVAVGDPYITDEDVPLSVAAPGVLANDSDVNPGDMLEADPLSVVGPSNGTVSLNVDGSFLYTPSTDFCGGDSFTYEATDGQLSSNPATVRITVNCINDPPVANDDVYSAVEDTTLTVAAPGVLSNDTDAEGSALTAALDTGTSDGTVAFDVDGSFVYTPTLNFCGPDSFTYHANDGALDSSPATVTLDVACVNDPPVMGSLSVNPAAINENDSVTLSGDFSDPDIGDTHTVTIDWGDGSNTVLSLTGGERTFSAMHQYLDDDPSGTPSDVLAISVDVTDFEGLSDGGSTSVTVNNVAPVLGPISAPTAPVHIADQPINVSAGFADVGTLDTHTAVWDWGDGTTSAGTVAESGGSGTASGSHTYAYPGVYIIGLTLTDDDTGTAQAIFDFLVVYDPDAGFVTGGGHYDDPGGRVNLGFTLKYHNGEIVPRGNLQFQLHGTSLNFHSDAFDWLVVRTESGRWAQFMGTGSINQQAGTYQFRVWLTDGSPDTWRIRIWSGANVLYDNGAEQPLGGGSIQVH